MPDTTNRPTPEELADKYPGDNFEMHRLLERLAEHGYVIVHPDDFPERPVEWKMCDYPNGIAEGWNELRYRVFGDDGV